jgi:transcriptional regulator with XRE-family HTH domain
MPARNLGARIGERLRVRRESLRWSQAQLAEAAGVTPNYVGVVERGEKLPTLETLDAFARAIGASPGALIADDEPDDWADEAVALARSVPVAQRRLLLAILRAAVTATRDERGTKRRPARRS